MAVYTVQTSVIPSGTAKFYLTIPTGGLTPPAFQSLQITDEIAEKLDSVAGSSDVEQWSLEFIEDYSVYAEGFWYKVLLGSYAYLQITLNEGTGEKHLFYGEMVRGQTTFEEYSLASGAIGRRGTMALVSFLARLKTLALDTVYTDMDTNTLWLTPTNVNGVANGSYYRFALVRQVMAQALSSGLGQSYDVTDVNQLSDEFKISNTPGGTYIGFDEWYVWEVYLRALGWGVDGHVERTYVTAWEFISVFAKSFGLIPRYRYDVAGGRHLLDLISRGRSYADDITLPVPIKSQMITGVRLDIESIQINRGYSGGKYYYKISNDTVVTTEPAAWQADLTITLEPDAYGSQLYLCFYDVAGENIIETDVYEYYDYDTSAYVQSNGVLAIATGLARYYANRLGGVKRIYERTYPSIKANDGSADSQTNITLGRYTIINDGVGNRDFYATEVRKNPRTNELFVAWQEV